MSGGAPDVLPRRPRVRALGAALPGVVAGLVLATIAVGLTIRFATHVELGTALPPFWMKWAPALRRPVIAGILVALLLVLAAPLAIDRVRSPALFALLAYGGTLALGLAVNAARRGTGSWDHVFSSGRFGSYEANFEYLPALRLMSHGVAYYVRHYPAELPYLPTHAKGNPPGPVVVMQLLSLDTPGRLATACIAIGALCGPLAYALGRELGAARVGTGERRGRIAAALTAFSPSVVLFGVTSADYAFAAIATASAWLLVARRPALRGVGCVVAAIATFFSWVLLAVPVWAVLVRWRRDGLVAAAQLAGAAFVAIVAFNGLLALVWGYDPIAILRALGPVYAHGEAAMRPYAFWLFGSPAAFVGMLGVPIAWAALRALGRGEPAALALAVVILVAAIAGFTKAETERIWLPFVPLACVAAAARPPARLRLALALLALQAIVIEILFQTIW